MVNLEALVLSHFFCQFNWETIGIIEFENILAFQGILASFLQLGQEMIQVAWTSIDGPRKGFFFPFDDFFNKVAFFKNFWIVGFHDLTYCRNQFIKEGLINPQSAAMHNRSTKEAAKNIAPTLIAWQGPITDGKGKSTDMVSDDLKAHVVAIWIVSFARNFFDFTNDRHKEVSFKVSFCPLNDRRKTFQTSAGIDILIWQFLVLRARASWIRIKLGQNNVPDFDIAIIFQIFF